MEKENKGKSKFWKGVLAGSLVTALAGFGIVGVATGISVIGRTVIENQAQNTTAEGSGQRCRSNPGKFKTGGCKNFRASADHRPVFPIR